MAKATPRLCSVDDCGRAHLARGYCGSHYSVWYRETHGPVAGTHHVYFDRTCEVCGKTWSSPRAEARFCTAKCKGVHLSQINRRKSPLPKDHPVMLAIAAAKAEAKAARKAVKQKPDWHTPRECPACAATFCPLYTSTTVCCTDRCSKRLSRRRRRAREHGARGEFTWGEFMRIAKKFDYCCAYCGEKPERLDPDHVIPLSRGGSNTPSNLLPSCPLCNSLKGAMTLSDWAAWLERTGRPARRTSWDIGDQRYVHLTDALLDIAKAA